MLARFVNMKKHFGATKAVDGITVEVEAGEIRAIVGEMVLESPHFCQ